MTGQPVDPNAPPARPALKLVAKDAESRTLYVSRPVTNAAEIITWAKAQGFKATLPASDLHVTVAYSRAPVDWMKAGDDGGKVEIDAGGPRLVQTFGSAVVLLFGSWQLDWRHERLKDLGASWDHAEYQPHITITYAAPDDLDVTKVEPYRGRILLGPEKFEELNEDWRAGVTEDGGGRAAVSPFAA